MRAIHRIASSRTATCTCDVASRHADARRAVEPSAAGARHERDTSRDSRESSFRTRLHNNPLSSMTPTPPPPHSTDAPYRTPWHDTNIIQYCLTCSSSRPHLQTDTDHQRHAIVSRQLYGIMISQRCCSSLVGPLRAVLLHSCGIVRSCSRSWASASKKIHGTSSTQSMPAR